MSIRAAARASAFAFAIAYPVAAYFVWTELAAPQFVLLGLGVLSLLSFGFMGGRRFVVAPRPPRAELPPRRQGRRRLWLTIAVLAAIGCGAIASLAFQEHRWLLLQPVLINSVLLAVFASSLGTDVPLVERFARLEAASQGRPLALAEVLYCRRLTLLWCAFFTLNGGIALGLALWAPVSWWALYTGGVAYGLMGLFFAAEYLVRKYRFRHFSDSWLDSRLRRVLSWVRGSVETRSPNA